METKGVNEFVEEQSVKELKESQKEGEMARCGAVDVDEVRLVIHTDQDDAITFNDNTTPFKPNYYIEDWNRRFDNDPP